MSAAEREAFIKIQNYKIAWKNMSQTEPLKTKFKDSNPARTVVST